MAEKCLTRQPALAITALLEHPDQTAAAPLLLKASRGAAYEDPALALAGLAAAGEAATSVEVSVVMAIGGQVNPQGTAEALARYDLPITDYLAVEAFTRGWAAANPEEASEWVTDLPAGELRDGGAAGLAREVGDEDSVGGYLWALEIGDREIRERVLSPWRERLLKDRTALESMASDSRLSPAQQNELRDRFYTPPPEPSSP